MSDSRSSSEPSMDEILLSIRRILAEDESGSLLAPSLRTRADSDVLDLTEALNDDGTVRHIAPMQPVTPEPPRAFPDGRVAPVPPRPEGAEAMPRLVSQAVSEAVAASFSRLATISQGEKFDEMVRDALRPLLQRWLDQHLPELVERLVKAEIARVVGASRPTAP